MTVNRLSSIAVLAALAVSGNAAHPSTIRAGGKTQTPACITVRVDPTLPLGLTLRVTGLQGQAEVLGVLNDRLNVISELPPSIPVQLELLRIVRSPTPGVTQLVAVANVSGRNTNGAPTLQGDPGKFRTNSGAATGTQPGCGADVTLFRLNPTIAPFLTYAFNSEAPSGDAAEVNAYYAAVDPRSSRTTLGGWWQRNGFTASGAGGVGAAYLNGNELGLGRNARCLKREQNVACYVTNYGEPDGNPEHANEAHAATDRVARSTLAMEYTLFETAVLRTANVDFTNLRVVKFFAFNGGTGAAPRITHVDLDGNGSRSVPRLCTNCHGGFYNPGPPYPILESVSGIYFANGVINKYPPNFLPFDLAGFTFPAAAGRNHQEASFYELNQIVKATEPTPGIQDLINGWYKTGATQNTDWLPDRWHNMGSQPVTSDDLYKNVIAHSCRTCHLAQPDPPINSLSFRTFEGLSYYNGLARYAICAPDFNPRMPHAKVTHGKFRRSDQPSRLVQAFAWGSCP